MACRSTRPLVSGRKVDGRLDRRRLALVAARFQSPHDGERLAALEAAGRLLAAGSATWADLIDGPSQAHSNDTIGEGRAASHHQTVETLAREAGDLLTPWERRFLDGCLGFDRLSEKQQRTLAEIHRKVTARAGHA